MKTVGLPVWPWKAVERPPMSQRSHIAISGSTAIWACSAACSEPCSTSSGKSPASACSGSSYQSAWVLKLSGSMSSVTRSRTSWSETRLRWKAITCSVTDTVPNDSVAAPTSRRSRIRST